MVMESPGIEEEPSQYHRYGEGVTDTKDILKAASAEMEVEGKGGRREKRKRLADL